MLNALFFHAYYAYLQGDLEKTRMFYEMLKEEFKVSKNRDALDQYQLRELKNIRSALESGSIPSIAWINEADTPAVKMKEESGIKQKELVKRIYYEAMDSLRDCLKSDSSLHLYNIEHPCGSYGQVDMVYMDSVTAYPVEIKPLEGRHDILGQIAKYTLYFRYLLNLKHFKRVQPVTICNSYDRHTLTELKRMSVYTLRYGLSKDKVIIEAI